MHDDGFMGRAIALSFEAINSGGGPFGAIIVLDGQIIGQGTNRVVIAADPTAHAEIVAIRMACQAVGSHILDHAIMYTTCEPCPMCLGAIWWARLSRVIYGNTRQDAASIGFDDEAIYRELSVPLESRTLPMHRLRAEEAFEVFRQWLNKPDRTLY
jgi:guanine deaminase